MEDQEGLDLSEAYGTNPKAEIDGVWQEIGGGAAIKVARLGNKEASRAYKKIPKAIRNMFEEGILDDSRGEAFLAGFMSKHILKDWKNLKDKGALLPDYTEDIGKKFLLQYRRFRERVWEISADDDLFNVEADQDAKNLQELSTGSSGTTPMPSKPFVVES